LIDCARIFTRQLVIDSSKHAATHMNGLTYIPFQRHRHSFVPCRSDKNRFSIAGIGMTMFTFMEVNKVVALTALVGVCKRRALSRAKSNIIHFNNACLNLLKFKNSRAAETSFTFHRSMAAPKCSKAAASIYMHDVQFHD